MSTLPWPAFASLTSFVGAVYTLRLMWAHRDRPGAQYWGGFIIAIAVWTSSYGVALLEFDPLNRELLEAGIYLGKNFCAPMILGFALAYTGREEYAYSRLMKANLFFWLVASGVYATNPIHGLVWTGYQINPVLGVATVTYSREPLLYAFYAIAYIQIGLAFALLFENLSRYGSLYRTQIFTVVGGVLIPWLTSMAWLFEIGPVPQLNLTPMAFTFTVIATTYALFRADMFEVAPPIVREKAIEEISDPFLAVDTAGNLVDFNPAAEAVVSDIDGRLGTPISDILPELADCLDESDPGETELSLSVDGADRQFDLNTSVFRGRRDEIRGRQIILRDITALKNRERDLKRREKELERQNQRLDQFASIVSHDLRNPLGTAKTYVDFAEETGDEEDFDAIRTSLDRMDSMIEKMLTMAGAETTVDDRAQIDLESLARDAWQTTQTQGGELEVSLDDSAVVAGDRELLRNVFENLFRNAVDHNDSPVTIRVGQLNSSTAGFYIEDDGSGIPESQADDIFDHGHTTNENGTGLGLAIVREFVTAHGWEITATEGSDGGARFEIYTMARQE